MTVFVGAVADLATDEALWVSAFQFSFVFVFAMLRTGSSFLAATGVDRRMTDVVQALLVLALLVPPAVGFVIDRRRSLHAPVRGASRGRVVS